MLEVRVRPRGPYDLALSARTPTWARAVATGRMAYAWQCRSGEVVIRVEHEADVERARFMLALDDDTSAFVRRFRRDRMLGTTVTRFAGLRPLRTATVAHSLVRAVCGQLVEARRARATERRVLSRLGTECPETRDVAASSPASLAATGLTSGRATTLVQLCRTYEMERFRDEPTAAVASALQRRRGIGPWSVGVVALYGLGRYDHGLVGDLGLVKLQSALQGCRAEPADTASLLGGYDEWAGLASVFMLSGFTRGLIPGATTDRARAARSRPTTAASRHA